MIFDNIKNAGRYAGTPFIGEALALADKYSDPGLDIGRYPCGDALAAVVNRYTTAEALPDRYENHRGWIDIQYVVSGCEEIRVCPREGMEAATPFDAAADYEFCRTPEAYTSLILHEGDFAVLYPDETHYPQLAAGEPCDVRKIVFKVRV